MVGDLMLLTEHHLKKFLFKIATVKEATSLIIVTVSLWELVIIVSHLLFLDGENAQYLKVV